MVVQCRITATAPVPSRVLRCADGTLYGTVLRRMIFTAVYGMYGHTWQPDIFTLTVRALYPFTNVELLRSPATIQNTVTYPITITPVTEEHGTHGLTTPFPFPSLALMSILHSCGVRHLIQAFLRTCFPFAGPASHGKRS